MKRIVSILLGIFAASIASIGIHGATVSRAEEPSVPTDMYVDPGGHNCVVTWNDEDNNAWNLRYRPFAPIEAFHLAWNFENQNISDWTLIDDDGDGLGWDINSSSAYAHNSEVSMASYSYSRSALNPDNWLIGPKIPLDGTLSLWAGQRSATYRDNFAIYLCVGEFSSTADFVKISDDYSPRNWTQYTIDLSEYGGQEGYFAIRHYNSYNRWALFIDDVALDIPEQEQEWIYVNNLDEREYTIEGLELNTEYEVQVQAIGDDGTLSDWCRPDVFTTLEEEPATPMVHILGDIDDQAWAPDAGTKMAYDPETGIYTATIFVDEERSFGFSTEIDIDNLGGWNYLEPFRFGPVSTDDIVLLTDETLGQPLELTFKNYRNIQVLSAGEYQVTVSLTDMYVIIDKISEPPHGYQTGDVNHDLYVNINDVTDLVDYLLIGSDYVCSICADVDGDGIVSIIDLTDLIDDILRSY